MRAAEEQRFSEFVRTSAPRLRRTAFLVCGDWHRAEDAAQHAFVKLYLTWSRVNDRDAMERYVRTTAVRWLIDESRRPWRRVQLPGDLPDEASREEDDEVAVAVRTALAKVPPRQRAAIVLRYYEGYDVTETAALLDCSPGTVKSQTARGLATLHRLLDDAGLAMTGQRGN